MSRAGILAVLLALSGGCAYQAGIIEALAKDTASDCVSVSVPLYGSIAVGRANRDGVELDVAAGHCTLKHAPAQNLPASTR